MSARNFISRNPSSGEVLKEFECISKEETKVLLGTASRAFDSWRETPLKKRTELLHKAADLLEDEKRRLGELMTVEMGKPIKEAQGEAAKCAWVCRYFADNAEEFLLSRRKSSDAKESYVRYDPLGVILAIMPWNFPFWQVFRFAAPALTAGNAALLKHAPNVPQCAQAIEGIFREAGFPEGVFVNLFVSEEDVGDIISHNAVSAVTLTGSDRAGRSVASTAGRALKKTVMELGGSDPFIVLKDADLKRAAETGVQSRALNSGQSCIAAKRFIVVKEVWEEFCDLMKKGLARLKMGDPLQDDADIGPLAREDLRNKLHRQVTESVEKGAEVVLGGKVPEGKGYFYPATMLTRVAPGMPAADEETFGPVAAVIEARDTEDAVRLANHTPYGLGASVWTADTKLGAGLASKINAGCIFVNGMVKSDPRLPFGGIKESGYGRELSEEGIREFVNIKTVWISD